MLSLVVATLGRTRELERFLASLAHADPGLFEVLVVDQNEPGFLVPLLVEFNGLPIRHLRSDPGLSRARNVGLAEARGEIIGLPDDDCCYGPATVSTVLRLFDEHPEAGIVTGRTCDADGRESVSRHLGVSKEISCAEAFWAGNSNALFVRRAAAKAAGGFDETLGVGAQFGSGEETDFLLRALGSGVRVRHEPELVVFHEQVSGGIDRVRRYAPGYGRVRRIHGMGLPGRDMMRAALRAGALACTGDRQGALERIAWLSGAVRGYAAPIPRARAERDTVLGVRFSPQPCEELVRAVLEEPIPAGTGPRLVVTANVDHIVKLRRDPDFRSAYAAAWAVTADGMPVLAYARSRGLKHLQRITGCELLCEVVSKLSPARHRCFFAVGSGAVAKRLEARLLSHGFEREHYEITVPPFGFELSKRTCVALARRIRAFEPTHLVLGVGAPKSEVFAHRYRDVIGDCYVLCVGSAVDIVAGVRVRAPALMRRTGFEWLWRVAREPVRLFPRYFISSWGFLRVVWTDLSKS